MTVTQGNRLATMRAKRAIGPYVVAMARRKRLVIEGATLEAVEHLAASAGVSPWELLVRALRREDAAQRGASADAVSSPASSLTFASSPGSGERVIPPDGEAEGPSQKPEGDPTSPDDFEPARRVGFGGVRVERGSALPWLDEIRVPLAGGESRRLDKLITHESLGVVAEAGRDSHQLSLAVSGGDVYVRDVNDPESASSARLLLPDGVLPADVVVLLGAFPDSVVSSLNVAGVNDFQMAARFISSLPGQDFATLLLASLRSDVAAARREGEQG